MIRALRSLDRAGLIERIPHQAPDGSCAKTEYRVTIPGLEEDLDGGSKEKTRHGSQAHPAGAGDLDIAQKSEPGHAVTAQDAIAANTGLSERGPSPRPGHRPEIRTRPYAIRLISYHGCGGLVLSEDPRHMPRYHTPRDSHPAGIPRVQGQTGSRHCMR